MKTSALNKTVAVLALSLAVAAPSLGYRMTQAYNAGGVLLLSQVPCNARGGFLHWRTYQLNFYLNPAGQGVDKAFALTNAMLTWHATPNHPQTLSLAGTTTAKVSASDNRNTIAWDPQICRGSCEALVLVAFDNTSQELFETDIAFNDALNWKTNTQDYDTQAMAVMEFGYALGIGTSEKGTTPIPSMHGSYFGLAQRSLEQDDFDAMACLASRYPAVTAFTPILACTGNTPGSSFIQCCLVAGSGGCNGPFTLGNWNYQGNAAFTVPQGQCLNAHFPFPPGCSGSPNQFSVNVTNSCGVSTVATTYAPCP